MLNGSNVRNGGEAGIPHMKIEDIIQNLKEIHDITQVDDQRQSLEEAISQLQDFKDGRLFGRLVDELRSSAEE